MRRNPILDTDSYKGPMWLLYPPEVTNVFSYGESRGGRYSETVFFGLQPWLRQLVEQPVTTLDVYEASDFSAKHGIPFNEAGWHRIVNVHGGYLPLRIKAVLEGTLVPTRNVLVTVENTDPLLPWLTTYVETALLRQVWYATTVATRIFNMKRGIKSQFERTADTFDNLPFSLLDFSSRGCASYGANEIGGAAYLANFLGSDSMPAVRYANYYYDSDMAGFSVPATEHSIMCAWGHDREAESFKHMIDRVGGPGKIVSVVSDTWNIFEAADKWAELAPYIQNSGTTLVVRPDSGHFGEVIPPVLKSLARGFGTRRNGKGFEVINGAKLLWGDGIDENRYRLPFFEASDLGFSADSIMVGSGGGLMQANIDRDTCKWAFKASAISSDEGRTWTGISKDPITDQGKRSKRGRLSLIRGDDGALHTVPKHIDGSPAELLQLVYENGSLFNPVHLDGIRARIDAQL